MSSSGRVRAVAACVGGRTVVTHLESSGLSAARATPWGLHLVAAGASPLDGDELELDVRLEAGARLDVRGVGAPMARRSSRGGDALASRMAVRAVVAGGARLGYLPAPGIAAGGSTHRCEAVVELGAGAELVWRDEVVLGRFGEPTPGTWWSARRVVHDGHPMLASEVGLGPGAPLWRNRGVTAGARAFASLLLVGPALAPANGQSVSIDGARAAALTLEGPGIDLVALGDVLARCRVALYELLRGLAGSLPEWMLVAGCAAVREAA